MAKLLSNEQSHLLARLSFALCTCVLLMSLLFLTIFIVFKGSYFFWPMHIYQITTDYPNAQSKQERRFELTPLSLPELSTSINQRLSAQYRDTPENQPTVAVTTMNEVYQITLSSGDTKLGYFVEAQHPKAQLQAQSLKETLASMQVKVDILAAQQQTVNQQLTPLHRAIAELNQKRVALNAPARRALNQAFLRLDTQAQMLNEELRAYALVFENASGQPFNVYLQDIAYLIQPNKMTLFEKLDYALARISQFLTESPKQAATNGGVFPALFGTVLMVIIMAIVVAPFGALAAIYLHEYAPDNNTTASLRICISNMAGVPSVVYGVFGLGFFVYTLGGNLDRLFYADSLPSPTFGTPGLIWAALTMALLTLPVVIVATEEGLRRVPKGLRSGSYALGATKWETIVKTVLPIASPGIMTGVILAIARAAGEVAPLILVGAVKYAPTLPVDANFPFVHLERQFMHLGAFIYDGAFYNQTNTQGSSMMFASCLLLLIIVFSLNIVAIILRQKLMNRYTA